MSLDVKWVKRDFHIADCKFVIGYTLLVMRCSLLGGRGR